MEMPHQPLCYLSRYDDTGWAVCTPHGHYGRGRLTSKKCHLSLTESERGMEYPALLHHPGARTPDHTAGTMTAPGRHSCINTLSWTLNENLAKTVCVDTPTSHLIRRHAANVTRIPLPSKLRRLNPPPCTATSSSHPRMDVCNVINKYAEDGVEKHIRQKHRAQAYHVLLCFRFIPNSYNFSCYNSRHVPPAPPSPQISQPVQTPSPSCLGKETQPSSSASPTSTKGQQPQSRPFNTLQRDPTPTPHTAPLTTNSQLWNYLLMWPNVQTPWYSIIWRSTYQLRRTLPTCNKSLGEESKRTRNSTWSLTMSFI